MFNIESRWKSISEFGIYFDLMDGFQTIRRTHAMYVCTVTINSFLLVKIKTAFEAVILDSNHIHGKLGVGSNVLIEKKSFIILRFLYFSRNILSVA